MAQARRGVTSAFAAANGSDRRTGAAARRLTFVDAPAQALRGVVLPQTDDLDQSRRPTAAKSCRMAFDPRAFNFIEVAGIATIILSLALVAYIVFFY